MKKEYEKIENEKTKENKAIAVHCTHGLNRTSYVVISFLMEQKIFNNVDEAINTFEKCRGEKIEREFLLDDLR